MTSRVAFALALAATVIAGGCEEVCDGPACAHPQPWCSPDPADPRLRLDRRWSILTHPEANPEIVQFFPNGGGRALATSTDANRLLELFADEDRLWFGDGAIIDPGNDNSDLTSFVIHPGEQFAAIAVSDYGESDDAESDCRSSGCFDGECVFAPRSDAPDRWACKCLPDPPPGEGVPAATAAGCGCGSVIFVDVRPGRFGDVLGRVGVGYSPDGLAFSSDGRFLITADEDDRDISCKPSHTDVDLGRDGGAISILQLAPVPAADCQTEPVALGDLGLWACRTHQVVTAWDRVAEPEDVAISSQGLAVVTIQDSNELGFIQLPTADRIDGWSPTLERVNLADETCREECVGPDGPDFSPDGRWLLVTLEDEDAILVADVSLWPLMRITERHRIADDLPSIYNRDETSSRRQIEPEQLMVVEAHGRLFALVTLQESGAIIAYRLDEERGTLTYDSSQPVGFDFAKDFNGSSKGRLRPEGMAVLPAFGPRGRTLAITANEEEASLTLVRSSCPE